MKPFAEAGGPALRVLYYLAVLLAILVIASHRLNIRPSFIYQGF